MSNFTKLIRIEHLDFSRNRLEIIRELDFAGQIDLVYLNLSHNQIETCIKGSFLSLKRLKHLDLRSTRLKTFEVNLFTHLVVLKSLNLENISGLNLFDSQLSRVMINLHELNLESSRCTVHLL